MSAEEHEDVVHSTADAVEVRPAHAVTEELLGAVMTTQ
jgi:hypothetical protein